MDQFLIFLVHKYLSIIKLFAHLLSNFDLDLSILFIVISKIIKYTFLETCFLKFAFCISFFKKNIVSWNIYFFKKKLGEKKFFSSNMLPICFLYEFVDISKRKKRNSEFDQLSLYHSRYSKLLVSRYENLAWKTYEF